jgi:hypothetical protein
LGTWKLQSCIFVDAETGRQSNPLAIDPVGYLNYSFERQMMGISLADNVRLRSALSHQIQKQLRCWVTVGLCE